MNKLKKILYPAIVIIFFAFAFQSNPKSQSNLSGGWQLQTIGLGVLDISDMDFIDSLTGFAITSEHIDSSYILKTTNSGNNWIITDRLLKDLQKVSFINPTTGFICGAPTYSSTGSILLKTTNQGINWISISGIPSNLRIADMAVLNEDTMWIIDGRDFDGGVYKTTNGGISWTL